MTDYGPGNAERYLASAREWCRRAEVAEAEVERLREELKYARMDLKDKDTAIARMSNEKIQ